MTAGVSCALTTLTISSPVASSLRDHLRERLGHLVVGEAAPLCAVEEQPHRVPRTSIRMSYVGPVAIVFGLAIIVPCRRRRLLDRALGVVPAAEVPPVEVAGVLHPERDQEALGAGVSWWP